MQIPSESKYNEQGRFIPLWKFCFFFHLGSSPICANKSHDGGVISGLHCDILTQSQDQIIANHNDNHKLWLVWRHWQRWWWQRVKSMNIKRTKWIVNIWVCFGFNICPCVAYDCFVTPRTQSENWIISKKQSESDIQKCDMVWHCWKRSNHCHTCPSSRSCCTIYEYIVGQERG